MKKRKVDPLETLIHVPADDLFHLIMACQEWLAEHEAALGHVRRTGRWACEDAEKADAGEALALDERVRIVRDAQIVAVTKFPRSVWRHIESLMADDDSPDELSPLSGQAAQDLADLLGEQP